MSNKKKIEKRSYKKFRMSGKALFLTYSKCDLNLSFVLSCLKFKLKSYVVINHVITQEQHEDGTNHIHVFIETKRRFDIKSETFLDIPYYENDKLVYCHGNYVVAKDKPAVVEYVLKDTKNFDEALISSEIKMFLNEDKQIVSLETVIIKLAEEGKITEALELIKTKKPEMYMKSHMHLEKSLRSIYLKKLGFVSKFDLKNFDVPADLMLKLEKAFNDKISVFIEGPSNTGKSQFVQAFLHFKKKNPLIVNNIDALRFYKQGVNDCLVFDDVKMIDYFRTEELIKLFDSCDSTTINIKHSSVQLPENIQRFFISNMNFRSFIGYGMGTSHAHEDVPLAIERRVTVYTVEKSLILVKEKKEE